MRPRQAAAPNLRNLRSDTLKLTWTNENAYMQKRCNDVKFYRDFARLVSANQAFSHAPAPPRRTAARVFFSSAAVPAVGTGRAAHATPTPALRHGAMMRATLWTLASLALALLALLAGAEVRALRARPCAATARSPQRAFFSPHTHARRAACSHCSAASPALIGGARGADTARARSRSHRPGRLTPLSPPPSLPLALSIASRAAPRLRAGGLRGRPLRDQRDSERGRARGCRVRHGRDRQGFQLARKAHPRRGRGERWSGQLPDADRRWHDVPLHNQDQ